MWIIFAILSAFFAGVTAIFAKIGIENVNSNLATALRTIVVAFFAWIMAFVVGSHTTINEISLESLIFLILSGVATGASWLCYFKALQMGDVNKVVPIDKSSTVLTIILAGIFLQEPITLTKGVGICVIAVGTYLMIEPQKVGNEQKETEDLPQEIRQRIFSYGRIRSYYRKKAWMFYALLAAVFASLTAILGKVGIGGVESNLGTAIRTVVVLIMVWIIVFAQGSHKQMRQISKRSWIFISLSGLATGLSWLCYYYALQKGLVSVVVPIDKLSVLVVILFGYIFLKERLKKRALLGLVLIVIGILCLLI